MIKRDTLPIIEKLIPIDLGSMGLNTMRYSFLMNESGGIIDDLIINLCEINEASEGISFLDFKKYLESFI